MLTLVTAEPEHSLEELPGRPWAVRRAAGPAGRPALEIYVADVFVDLLVLPGDWPLAPHIVRGACSATWAGQSYVAAWGVLPAAGRGRCCSSAGAGSTRRPARRSRSRWAACSGSPTRPGGSGTCW